MDPFWISFSVLVLGVAMGALGAYLYLRQQAEVTTLEREQELRIELSSLGATHEALVAENHELRTELTTARQQSAALREQLADLRIALSQSKSAGEQLHQRLDLQDAEMIRLQRTSEAHFERTAERLLREKGRSMTEQNSVQLSSLITPLRERIQDFERQINERFTEQTRDTVSLRQEIVGLSKLNSQLSEEANNLAGALRGNTKTQGDWGEWQLLRLLEASGLQDGVHFRTQASFGDAEGRQKRPDCIIHLPENKHLVVDSKVSLVAYERYCACQDGDLTARRQHAADHLRSLRQHVTDLAGKNYTELDQLNTPDFLFLFVPIEPAYGLALTTDQTLFNEALNRNVVIVTPTTLLSTLRTVSYLWKQDDQRRNVRRIARQSGLLYDSMVGFVQDLQRIGHRLDQAQQSYQDAFRKLSQGGKPGATILGRAERIRKLGASTKKRLDPGLLSEEE
ncbi:DNA recombination protein RmuC [Neolewinella sp.]|uniref:DNA recombination protein RmuC n=1 Tax=Neolewinella sp. TaxID=2993543 RepID=UPI003B523FF0